MAILLWTCPKVTLAVERVVKPWLWPMSHWRENFTEQEFFWRVSAVKLEYSELKTLVSSIFILTSHISLLFSLCSNSFLKKKIFIVLFPPLFLSDEVTFFDPPVPCTSDNPTECADLVNSKCLANNASEYQCACDEGFATETEGCSKYRVCHLFLFWVGYPHGLPKKGRGQRYSHHLCLYLCLFVQMHNLTYIVR